MLRKAAFAFIGAHFPAAAKPLAEAQAYAETDPATSLAKSRLAAELLVKSLGQGARLTKPRQETAETYLRRVAEAGRFPRDVTDAFHRVRILGNVAVHENRGTVAKANEALDRLAIIGAWLSTKQAAPSSPPASQRAPARRAANRPAPAKAAPAPKPRRAVRTKPKPSQATAPVAKRPTMIRRLFWIIVLIVALFVAIRWLPHLMQTSLHR